MVLHCGLSVLGLFYVISLDAARVYNIMISSPLGQVVATCRRARLVPIASTYQIRHSKHYNLDHLTTVPGFRRGARFVARAPPPRARDARRAGGRGAVQRSPVGGTSGLLPPLGSLARPGACPPSLVGSGVSE